jgi:hypothetical protein
MPRDAAGLIADAQAPLRALAVSVAGWCGE